jgi:hypothetical protein
MTHNLQWPCPPNAFAFITRLCSARVCCRTRRSSLSACVVFPCLSPFKPPPLHTPKPRAIFRSRFLDFHTITAQVGVGADSFSDHPYLVSGSQLQGPRQQDCVDRGQRAGQTLIISWQIPFAKRMVLRWGSTCHVHMASAGATEAVME